MLLGNICPLMKFYETHLKRWLLSQCRVSQASFHLLTEAINMQNVCVRDRI